MVSLLIVLLVVISPGVLIVSLTKKRLELFLPVSCAVTIGFLFFFGLAGILHIGVIAEMAIGAALWIWAVLHVLRNKEWRPFFRNIFTSGMFWFGLVLMVLTMSISGKYFEQWDEFSHWGDVIKVTVDLNGYSTNAASMSAFQTYPPGMVIFQYLLQKIHIMLGNSFSEWRGYFSYNLFLLCFMAPVFSGLPMKKLLFSVVSVISILLLPTAFFATTYYTLYIDVAVSIVFAYGVYVILGRKAYSKSFVLASVSTTCFLLPLLKDIGILFAAVLLLMYFFCGRKEVRLRNVFITAVSMAVPIVAWRINVSVTDAQQVFPFRYNLAELFRVLGGGGEPYRQTVLREFPRALVTKTFIIGNTGVGINYFVLIVILSVLLHFTLLKLETVQDHRSGKVIRIIMPILFLVYMGGLMITYMFQFPEYEAEKFSAFERYTAIPLCSASLIILYIWISILRESGRRFVIVLLCVILVFAPLGNTYSLLSRECVKGSEETRRFYSVLAEKVERNVPEDSTIYFISQQDTGKDFWVYHYLFRPHRTVIEQLEGYTGYQAGGYSIGKPYRADDVWSADISPEDLMDQWVERYDYVAILHANDYLGENYSALFDSKIRHNGLYKIDKENRIARLVE